MDIITATALATIMSALSVAVTAFSTSEGKPSLGPAYESVGGAVKYWALTLISTAVHSAVYWWAPLWFTAIFVSLAIVSLAFTAWWGTQVRKSQRRVKEIFAEAQREAQRKQNLRDNLEVIAEARKLNRQAREALNEMDVHRANELRERANELTAHLLPR